MVSLKGISDIGTLALMGGLVYIGLKAAGGIQGIQNIFSGLGDLLTPGPSVASAAEGGPGYPGTTYQRDAAYYHAAYTQSNTAAEQQAAYNQYIDSLRKQAEIDKEAGFDPATIDEVQRILDERQAQFNSYYQKVPTQKAVPTIQYQNPIGPVTQYGNFYSHDDDPTNTPATQSALANAASNPIAIERWNAGLKVAGVTAQQAKQAGLI